MRDRIANCYCRSMFWASGALSIHDCMPEIKQKQPQDRKTIFEILSLPVAKILSPVARQAPTKTFCWEATDLGNCPKRENPQKWLEEGAKNLLDAGSKSHPRVFCTTQTLFCTGATPFRTSARGLLLAGSKRPFVPSTRTVRVVVM